MKEVVGPTGIIDPPWAYEKSSRNEKLRGYSTDHEYKALQTEDMMNLPISKLMTYGFLWTTGPFIEDAYKLIRSWGMEPVTSLYWVKTSEIYTDGKDIFPEDGVVFKPSYGVGYWFRGCVEPIILFKAPGAPSIRTNDVGLLSPNGKHSRKPNSLHEMIENHFPGPYIELFGRRSRSGWTVLGNEAPDDGEDIRISIGKYLTQTGKESGLKPVMSGV